MVYQTYVESGYWRTVRPKKLRLKGCPRCKGDLLLEQEEYEKVYKCLQCGYRDVKVGVKR